MSDEGVCVVTHPLSAAGENATRSLLEILAAITSVCLVTADLPENSAIRGQYELIEITSHGAGQGSVPIAAFRFLRNQFRMVSAIAGRDERIVLFFGATSYVLPMMVAKLLGRTVVVEPRGDVPRTLRISWEARLPTALARALAGTVCLLERAGFRLADAIVTYTPGMAEELGLEPFENKLYPNGARFVDIERFAPEVPFEERDRLVGFLGRLDEEKGVRELAAAAARLPEDITFRFVGDGDLRPWLESRLAEGIETGRVEMAGWVDHGEVPAELNRLRLLVLPSSPTEGLPTTIIESLACGTPVYATPVAGVPDVVRDGETGFLMMNTDSRAIATDIEAIFQRGDLERIGCAGRELIEDEYSFEAAVDRYRRILGLINA